MVILILFLIWNAYQLSGHSYTMGSINLIFIIENDKLQSIKVI